MRDEAVLESNKTAHAFEKALKDYRSFKKAVGRRDYEHAWRLYNDAPTIETLQRKAQGFSGESWVLKNFLMALVDNEECNTPAIFGSEDCSLMEKEVFAEILCALLRDRKHLCCHKPNNVQEPTNDAHQGAESPDVSPENTVTRHNWEQMKLFI